MNAGGGYTLLYLGFPWCVDMNRWEALPIYKEHLEAMRSPTEQRKWVISIYKKQKQKTKNTFLNRQITVDIVLMYLTNTHAGS